MAKQFKIGDMDVIVLLDGIGRAPGPMYFQGTTPEQWEPHKRWLDHAGNVEFPFTCYLVMAGDRKVLIDTGLGPVSMFGFTGGDLLTDLATTGIKPEDIDSVFLTHLHVDHCGNVALPQDGKPLKLAFPNAELRWSQAEQDYWHSEELRRDVPRDAFPRDEFFTAVEPRFKPIEDGESLASGITVMATPGHTPGHAAVVLSSGDQRAFILGDAISCPVQLEEPEWSGLGDFDKALARRTQEAVLREAEGDGSLLTASHFPGLTFGRVLTGEGKRYWQPND